MLWFLINKQAGVSADRFREDLIELTGDGQLMLLQFRETADHESVLEVRGYHVLKQVHVTCAELAEALVHQATQFAVTFAPVILHNSDSQKRDKPVVKRQNNQE